MEIVKYEINKNILTIGFKENDSKGNPFIVYTQVFYDTSKTKQELLQSAYEQCRSAIEYEKTQTEHCIVSDTQGEDFIPEISKVTKLQIDFTSLSGKALDQYENTVSTNITFSIEGTDKAIIKDGKITEQIVVADTEYNVVATYENLVEKQKRTIFASKIIPTQVLESDKQMANFILDTTNRLDVIEKKINGGA